MKTFNIDSRDHYKTKVFPSPFHARQAECNENREWSRWFDYLSVPAYTCSTMEYFAGRNSCGVFDITPMTKHRITGKDALPFLNRLVTRDVTKIRPGPWPGSVPFAKTIGKIARPASSARLSRLPIRPRPSDGGA